jgi:hypothetical protein
MAEPTFLSWKLDDIAVLTKAARRRIVFGAGLEGLAAALVNASKRLGQDCTVLLAIAEDTCALCPPRLISRKAHGEN